MADAAKQFKRAIVMPNLVPPVTDAKGARHYREQILAARGENSGFEPLMVLYLTDNTSAEVINQAAASGVVAAKLYPAGATTNSDSGVTRILDLMPVFESMAKHLYKK